MMSEAFRAIKTIDGFKIEFQRLLKMLGDHINEDFYPRNMKGDALTLDQWQTVTFDSPNGDDTPFIEMKNGLFNFVVSERGREYQRVAADADETLERIFEGITFSLAIEFELHNRIKGQDSRRLIFAKQVELLNHLNPAWASNETKSHEKILLKYPFDDNASIRADYTEKHGWEAACQKYPLPKAK
jgi:hypothetical protein